MFSLSLPFYLPTSAGDLYFEDLQRSLFDKSSGLYFGHKEINAGKIKLVMKMET